MQQGMQQGIQKEKMTVVKKAFEAGLSIETKAMISGLSIDEIRRMRAELKLKKESDH
jgi:predicted transposase YdaD